MRILYHLPLCPFSRAARLALAEKKIDFHLKIEKTWQERAEFIDLNPAGETPVLVEPSGAVITVAIPEYLDEAYPESLLLLPGTPSERSEIRRICVWMDQKFYREVTVKLVWERCLKREFNQGGVDVKTIKEGTTYLIFHLQYLSWILKKRDWLGGVAFSWADISAVSHLSCVDYFGGIPWDKFPEIKNWYACIKSRPSFRPLLLDRFKGMIPAEHYANLDF